MLVPVENTNTALSIATFGLSGPKARPRDFQRTTELVCKFIVDTTQLLNRLSAHCDEKLQKVSRDLQRFEVQLRLLEYKLDSIDEEEGRAANVAEDRKADRAQRAADRDAARAEAEEAKQAARENRAAVTAGGGGDGANNNGPRLIGAPPGMGGGNNAPPPMMPGGRYGPGNVPLPGQAGKGMPLPPGFQQAGAAGGALIAVPPPPPMSRIVAQPPPMPQTAGLTTRKHPKLKGYFEMLEVGVPAQAVKARMQADGMKPEWLDMPDVTSPLPAISAQAMKTFYDSD